ncbi:hypothetical protein [Acinetobacter sp. ANC 4177]|uniref:hypothetical protein n=1 Tax=Acinetobacter sp. ANC 4177 TaxID=2529838 RepID=UPI00103D49D5|nr:hypothetical protein [Acinetobacter sp. ANC 4177]TCB73705.1 hypothetical protein E0H91_12195 [Acinetobacter sp. ANC 4177]
MKQNKRIENFIPFFATLLIFGANPPWFFWGIGYPIILFSAILIFLLNIKAFNKISTKEISFFALIIGLMSYFVILKGLGEIRISSLVFFLVLFGMFFLKRDLKNNSFELITKTYAVILGVSFVAWFINNFVFELPFKYDLNYGEILGKFDNITFYNYLFFIQPQLDYVRFYSIFDEPGVVGTLSAFILYGQRYALNKWYNLIIFIASIFTFSIAFYVITFLGMLFVFIYEKKIGFVVIMSSILALLSGFLMTLDSFKVVVLNRFSDFDDVFSRRSGGYINQFYDNLIESNYIYFGRSLDFFQNNKYLIDGQGYKIFVIEYGMFGLILIIFLYFYIFLKNRNLYTFVLLLIFLISFIQRPFLFTPWQILLFIVICSYLNNNQISRKV